MNTFTMLWGKTWIISEVFDFDYAWEVYKIPEKRQYGYYVLPILYGARFVGRIGPKLDRENKTMIINSLLLEEEHLHEDFVSELVATLNRFLQFHDASQVKIVTTRPKELKEVLLKRLNESLKELLRKLNF